jgi:hypothetical protein
VEFITPTLLKANGREVHRPDFGVFMKRLRDRVNALGTFYGEGPLEVDFQEIAFTERVLSSLRAFDSDQRLEALFEQQFDGDEVIPASLLSTYEETLERDPLLAPLYLVPVSGRRIARLRREGRWRDRPHGPAVAPVSYSADWGLDLSGDLAHAI